MVKRRTKQAIKHLSSGKSAREQYIASEMDAAAYRSFIEGSRLERAILFSHGLQREVAPELLERIREEHGIEQHFGNIGFERFSAHTILAGLEQLYNDGVIEEVVIRDLIDLTDEFGRDFVPVYSAKVQHISLNAARGGDFYELTAYLPNGQMIRGHAKRYAHRREFLRARHNRRLARQVCDNVVPQLHAYNGFVVDLFSQKSLLERVGELKKQGDYETVKQELIKAARIIKQIGDAGKKHIPLFRGRVFRSGYNVSVNSDPVQDFMYNIVLGNEELRRRATWLGEVRPERIRRLRQDESIDAIVKSFEDFYKSVPVESVFGNGDPHLGNFLYYGDDLRLTDWDSAQLGSYNLPKLLVLAGLNARDEKEIVTTVFGQEYWKHYKKQRIFQFLKSAVICYNLSNSPEFASSRDVIGARAVVYYNEALRCLRYPEHAGFRKEVGRFFGTHFGLHELLDQELAELRAKVEFDEYNLSSGMVCSTAQLSPITLLREIWFPRLRWRILGAAAVLGLSLASLPMLIPRSNEPIRTEERGGAFYYDDNVFEYTAGQKRQELEDICDDIGISPELGRRLLMANYSRNNPLYYKLLESSADPSNRTGPIPINEERIPRELYNRYAKRHEDWSYLDAEGEIRIALTIFKQILDEEREKFENRQGYYRGVMGYQFPEEDVVNFSLIRFATADYSTEYLEETIQRSREALRIVLEQDNLLFSNTLYNYETIKPVLDPVVVAYITAFHNPLPD